MKIKNLLLLVCGLLLGAGLCEAVLRLTGLGFPSPMISHGRLPFKARPGHAFTNRKEIVNRVVLNNWGFHDRDRQARSDRHRVLALGDSFVEGLQVTVEDLFTSRIERSLLDAGYDVEILNAGMSGAGTAYEVLLYEEFFRGKIDVDRVVLFICNGNDLPNNHPWLERRVNGNEVAGKVYVGPAGEIYVRRAARSWRQRLLAFLDRHSALSHTVHAALYRLKRSSSAGGGEASPSLDEMDGGRLADVAFAEEQERAWTEAVVGTLALIERWHGELRAERVELMVVLLPWFDHLLEGVWGHPHKARFVAELHALGERAGFPVLAIDFAGHEPRQIFTFDGERYGHFLPFGHAVVAEQSTVWLAEHLVRRRASKAAAP